MLWLAFVAQSFDHHANAAHNIPLLMCYVAVYAMLMSFLHPQVMPFRWSPQAFIRSSRHLM